MVFSFVYSDFSVEVSAEDSGTVRRTSTLKSKIVFASWGGKPALSHFGKMLLQRLDIPLQLVFFQTSKDLVERALEAFD